MKTITKKATLFAIMIEGRGMVSFRRLRERTRANKLVRFLKRRGVAAYVSKMEVRLA